MITLSFAYMVRNEMAYLPESLVGVEKIADEIVVVVDDRSNDGTWEFLCKKISEETGRDESFTSTDEILSVPYRIGNKYKIFKRKWDFEVNQKNFARDECTKDWIFFLDGDEVLSDNVEVVKPLIEKGESLGYDAISIRGHHFMGSLGFEDSWVEKHWWLHRIFKNKKEIRFKGTHHALLDGYVDNGTAGAVEEFRIFHFGYARNLIRVMEKNEQDRSTLEIHSSEFLDWWKYSHLFGFYPTKKYEGQIPKVILDKFKIPYTEGTVGVDLANEPDKTVERKKEEENAKL